MNSCMSETLLAFLEWSSGIERIGWPRLSRRAVRSRLLLLQGTPPLIRRNAGENLSLHTRFFSFPYSDQCSLASGRLPSRANTTQQHQRGKFRLR